MLGKKRKEKEKGRRKKGKKGRKKKILTNIPYNIKKKKLKWIIDLNVRNNTIKVLGKKHRMKAE